MADELLRARHAAQAAGPFRDAGTASTLVSGTGHKWPPLWPSRFPPGAVRIGVTSGRVCRCSSWVASTGAETTGEMFA